jgi:hypothetical protein
MRFETRTRGLLSAITLSLVAACQDGLSVRWAEGVGSKPARWRSLPEVLHVERPTDGWELDHAAFVELVQDGLDEWGTARSIRIERQLASSRESAEDGHSVVRLTLDRHPHERDLFGRTLLYTRELHGRDYAEIVEADVDIGGNAREAVRRHGPRLLRGIINHELGHVLGLDHPCVRLRVARAKETRPLCRDTHRTEIMYPSLDSDVQWLAVTPSKREYAAILAAYGADGQ